MVFQGSTTHIMEMLNLFIRDVFFYVSVWKIGFCILCYRNLSYQNFVANFLRSLKRKQIEKQIKFIANKLKFCLYMLYRNPFIRVSFINIALQTHHISCASNNNISFGRSVYVSTEPYPSMYITHIYIKYGESKGKG